MAAFDTIVARATAHFSIFDYTNIIREIKTHKMEIKKGFYAMGKKLDLNKVFRNHKNSNAPFGRTNDNDSKRGKNEENLNDERGISVDAEWI